MRILYDGVIYDMQVAGGVNRYFANLIGHLPPTVTPIVTALDSPTVNVPQHPYLRLHTYYRWGLQPNRWLHALEPAYFRALEWVTRPDVLHPTYYTQLGSRPLGRSRLPLVISVHDTIQEMFAAELDPGGLAVAAKRAAIAAADRIICVSESTRRDLLARYPAAADNKTTTIYHASELRAEWSWGDEPVPAAPYFLYVGSRWYYKNFDLLVKAFAELATCDPAVQLCVAGPPLSAAEWQAIAALGLQERVVGYPYPSDRHLAKLYRCSLALAYPSRYEGFGLPVLEAMACGTPAIAARASSIPEVAGEAALLFEPDSPTVADELTDCLRLLLESPAERDRWIAAGRDRVQQFSWQQAATATLAVYQSLL